MVFLAFPMNHNLYIEIISLRTYQAPWECNQIVFISAKPPDFFRLIFCEREEIKKETQIVPMSSLALSLQEPEHSSFSFLSSPSLFIQLSISFGPQKCLGRTAKRWKQNMACYTVLYTEMGKNVSFFKMILNYVL